jgi:hypothetical protein
MSTLQLFAALGIDGLPLSANTFTTIAAQPAANAPAGFTKIADRLTAVAAQPWPSASPQHEFG